MKRVLVTGGSGFIGRHALAPLVESGHEVHATTSTGASAGPDSVRWHRADLLAPEGCAALIEELRPTHLMHLAWYSQPGALYGSLENVRWTEASMRLLHEFARAGGERAVIAGTCAEYEWSGGVCSEKATPLAPASMYGAAKRAVGAIAERMDSADELSVGWARIFFTFGPAEHPDRLVASVINSLLRGEPAALSYGEQVRDFTYSEDVAGALVSLLESEVHGPVNVASGESITVRELASKIAKAMGREELLRFGARPASPGEPETLLADVARLTGAVGWQPRHSTDEGLARTIEWWSARAKQA